METSHWLGTSLSTATTQVCAQRGCSSGVPASTLRPHHWRPCSLSLVACTTTCRLQSCGHGVSSTEQFVSAIPGSASSRCWSAWSSSSALIVITPAAGSDISSSYRQPAFISNCCIHPLEQLASWYSVIRLLDRFLSHTKDIPVQPIISRHFALTIHISIRFRGLYNYTCYFGHDKNSHLIDWLIDHGFNGQGIQLCWMLNVEHNLFYDITQENNLQGDPKSKPL